MATKKTMKPQILPDWAQALVAFVIIGLALAWWNGNVERECEDQGGRMVWENNTTTRTVEGVCVLP